MKIKLILVVALMALNFASLANANAFKEGNFVDNSGQVLTTFCIDGEKWIITRHSSRGVEVKKSFVQDDMFISCSN